MTTRIGIDPGVTGAIAVLHGDSVRFIDMPVLTTSAGRRYVDPYSLLCSLVGWQKYSPVVVVERVRYMPGLAAMAAFSLGDSFGVVRAVLAAIKMSTIYVEPLAWKTAAGLRNKPKDYGRTLAIQQFPQAAKELARKKDIGRAEAMLIAAYGIKETPYRHGKKITKRKQLPKRRVR